MKYMILLALLILSGPALAFEYDGYGRPVNNGDGDDYANASQPYQAPQPSYGMPVYPTQGCIGAVVNGVCNGAINPALQPTAHCYGTMLNGECTGPMF